MSEDHKLRQDIMRNLILGGKRDNKQSWENKGTWRNLTWRQMYLLQLQQPHELSKPVECRKWHPSGDTLTFRGGKEMRMPAMISRGLGRPQTDRRLLTSGAMSEESADVRSMSRMRESDADRDTGVADTQTGWLAENTHGQELGNCGRFWCAHNFKVVAWISTGKYLKSMHGIRLTCLREYLFHARGI